MREAALSIRYCPLCKGDDTKDNLVVPWSKIHDAYQMLYGADVAKWTPSTGIMRMKRCLSCDLFFVAGAEAPSSEFYEALSRCDRLGFDYYPKGRPAFDLASKIVSAGDQVLDVGSGAGWFAEVIPHAQYFGLELNRLGLLAAKERGHRVADEAISMHAKSKRAYYDVVCSFEVLEHLSDPLSFLQDCRRVLKPNGKLFVSVPSADSFYPFVVNELLNLPPHHLTRWTDKALGNLANYTDFSFEGTQTTSLRQGGHAALYFSHVIENAEIKRLGIDAVGGVCLDPRFSEIRAHAQQLAASIVSAIASPLQLPRGITVCALFRAR